MILGLIVLFLTGISLGNGKESPKDPSVKMVYSDALVFKLSDRYYYLSDLLNYLKILGLISCLPSEKNFYLVHFLPGIMFQKSFPSITYQNLTSYKIHFEEVARLLKLLKYLNKLNFFESVKESKKSNEEARILLKQFESKTKDKINPTDLEYCNATKNLAQTPPFNSFLQQLINSNLLLEMEKILLVNQFLENKFGLNTFNVTDQEITQYQSKTKSNLTKIQVKELLINFKFNDSIINFINTLNRQSSAEYLWRK